MRRMTYRSVLLATAMAAGMMSGAARGAAGENAEAPASAAPAAGGDQAGSLDEILVFANRDQADSAKMRAVNTVDILSNADLEHTAVHNVAEALGLLPGVTVVNTGQSFFGGVDGASRGEGMFAAVRGLNTEFNVNMINGVEVAQGMPYSRGVQLSLLPPSGLQTIVLNKTSTADMDGDAIGGTIDFRTPTAFDYKDDLHASMTLSGRVESRARDYDRSGLGGGGSGELAYQFGRDHQFGVYVSGYYDKRTYANSEMAGAEAAQNDGGWAYAVTSDAAGSLNPAGVNPVSNIRQTGINVGVSEGETERYGGNVSLDWRPDDTLTAYFRASYAIADTQQNSTQSQIVSTNKSYAALANGLYGLSVDKYRTAVWYETNPEHADLATFQLGGDKKLGGWTLSPNVFYSFGDNDRPNHIEASIRNDQYGGSAARFPGGGAGMGSDDGFPVPVLSNAMYQALNDAGNQLWARRAGQLTAQHSGQDKTGGKLDVRYDFSDAGPLSSVKFGGKYIDSQRDVTNRDWTNGMFSALLGTNTATWNSLGIANGTYSSAFPGKYSWALPKVSQDALLGYFYKYQNAASLDTCGSAFVADNMNCNTQKGSEAVASGYVMADLEFGSGVEVIPGVRFEHTSIDNTFWNMDGTGAKVGAWARTQTQYNEPLPSILVNWRPDQNSVYRASVYSSYTRPAFVQLAGGASTSVSSDGVTTITQGNPNLKPIEAVNYDLSGEWSNSHGGQASLGGYYKHLSNYLYENGSGLINAANIGSGVVRYIEPTNGGSGNVYGIEAAFRQKFQDLPGWLSGFGINGNVTRQWTGVDLGSDQMGRNERIQNAPDWLANAGLFYERDGFSFDLIYNYTGAYVSVYNYLNQPGTWDDLWVRPTNRVDLHAGYQMDSGVSVDVSVSNLLGDYTYWSHVGRNSLTISDIVDSGTTTLLSLKYTY